ncbi:MAG: oxidoreductase [Acidobacteriota bacterium]
MKLKPKLAMYWAASCGGCEVSLLNVGEKILMVDRVFDIVFFPCIADFKYKDVEALSDDHIDLCLFNGAIRSSENQELAELLRRKSRLLVAYGSCAHEGCIPALSNLTTAADTLEAVFVSNFSTANPGGVVPRTTTRVPEGDLALPLLYDTVRALDQIVRVDYYIPGCPPEPPRIWEALEVFVDAFVGGAELPAVGSVLGATDLALCEECPLERNEKRVPRFFRPHEIVPDPKVCLLEQGIVCSGPATRGGCGALCPRAGMGCRGCYGLLQGVVDQGAGMVAAVAAVLGVGSPQEEESAIEQTIERATSSIVDPAGTFYRHSLAHSLLRRRRPSITPNEADEGS